MRGTNLITLNHDTVVDAMQEYFDKRGLDGKADFIVEEVNMASMEVTVVPRTFMEVRE